MNGKQAQDLGFDVSKNGRVWHWDTQTEFHLSEPLKKITPEELINRFGKDMFDAGVRWGKAIKMEEVKKALGIGN